MRVEVPVRMCTAVTSRVGWVQQNAGVVGTDAFGYGYGSTGKKSHHNKYLAYGKSFGKDDLVTCILDRTGDSIAIWFLVNGDEVAEDPAFQIPADELTDPLFLALCGKAGFELE